MSPQRSRAERRLHRWRRAHARRARSRRPAPLSHSFSSPPPPNVTRPAPRGLRRLALFSRPDALARRPHPPYASHTRPPSPPSFMLPLQPTPPSALFFSPGPTKKHPPPSPLFLPAFLIPLPPLFFSPCPFGLFFPLTPRTPSRDAPRFGARTPLVEPPVPRRPRAERTPLLLPSRLVTHQRSQLYAAPLATHQRSREKKARGRLGGLEATSGGASVGALPRAHPLLGPLFCPLRTSLDRFGTRRVWWIDRSAPKSCVGREATSRVSTPRCARKGRARRVAKAAGGRRVDGGGTGARGGRAAVRSARERERAKGVLSDATERLAGTRAAAHQRRAPGRGRGTVNRGKDETFPLLARVVGMKNGRRSRDGDGAEIRERTEIQAMGVVW